MPRGVGEGADGGDGVDVKIAKLRKVGVGRGAVEWLLHGAGISSR